MITEDYVSFETAKLLKEKGFDEICSFAFYKDGRIVDRYDSEFSYNYYDRPTLQMAMNWLEEKYGVFCAIRRHGNSDDGFSYSWNCEGKMGLSIGNGGGFKTATEAREDVIKYCLENLI